MLANGWALDGNIVCGAPDVQDDPVPFGGALVWTDYRGRAVNGSDYYGATIKTDGRVDVPAPLRSARLELGAPRPNPTRAGASFTLELTSVADADVAIFDCAGRRVASIASGELRAGRHELRWGGTIGGARASAGVYFVRARVGTTSLQRVLVLTR